MKKIVALGITVSILAGCQSAPQTYTNSDNNSTNSNSSQPCDFNLIPGTSFTPTELTKQYITNSFKSEPGSYDRQFSNKAYFAPLQTEAFKFTGKTEPNKYASSYRKENRIEINGKPYVYQADEYAEIATESCKLYWYVRSNYITNMQRDLNKTDGTDYTLADYQSLLGEKNFHEYTVPPAQVEVDKFKNIIKIRGDYDDGKFFRAWGSPKTNKLSSSSVQLYADVKFRSDWAFLDTAYDEDANRRNVTKIDTDTDCNEYGCTLTETVGIDIPISYLKTKTNGFEIKVSGKRESILKVKGYQVRQILDGIKPFI